MQQRHANMSHGTSVVGQDSRVLSREHILMLKDQVHGPEEDLVMDMKSIAKKLVDHSLASDEALVYERRQWQHKLEESRASLASAIASSQLDRDRAQVEHDQLMLQCQALAHKLIVAQKRAARVQTAAPRPVTPRQEGDADGEEEGVGDEDAAGIDDERATPQPADGSHLTKPYSPPVVYGAQLSPDAFASKYGEDIMAGASVDAGISGSSRQRVISDSSGEAKALASDVRYLKRRLRHAEIQTQRFETELRRLRPFFLHTAPVISTSYDIDLSQDDVEVDVNSTLPIAYPDLPALPVLSSEDPSLHRRSRQSRPRRQPRTGDAEAEHLLLAAKMLSRVRRVIKVPVDEAIRRKAEDIVLSDWPELALPPLPVEEDEEERYVDDEDEERVDVESRCGDEGRREGTPRVGGKGKRRASVEVQSTSRDTPLHNLLHAATATGSMSSSGSGKRPRVDGDGDGVTSPPSWKPATAGVLQSLQFGGTGTGTGCGTAGHRATTSGQANVNVNVDNGDLYATFDALDVLAEASASQESRSQSQSQPQPQQRAQIHQSRTQPSQAQPQAGPSRAAVNTNVKTRDGSAENGDSHSVEGGGGGGGPGGVKTKASRSPYIKWTNPEDEQLVTAVIKYGLRWDLVSAQIPTRTYHQVRQRFIRGLKLGKALPDEIEPRFGRDVRDSVKFYEDKRKANRARKASGGRIAVVSAAAPAAAGTSTRGTRASSGRGGQAMDVDDDGDEQEEEGDGEEE